jgi:hypothetical protein
MAYAELTRSFAEWLPGGANWCTFAVWASRQAGCTIRKQDLARAVSERLQARLRRRPILREAHRILGLSTEHIARAVGELSQGLPGIDRASDAVARGNRKVFEEIGREFARFLAIVVPGDRATPDSFMEGLQSGPPPEGQDLLRLAFAHYLDAHATDDLAERAQLMLLANVRIGLHEQTRLQPEISEAMDAALLDVADTRRHVLERLDEIGAAGPLRAIHTGAGRRLLNALADEVSEDLRDVARMITTERLMTIGLPGNRSLRLGSDVVGRFPPSLVELTNPALEAMLAEYETTANSLRDSGAIDWTDLPQRMRFIAAFFRAYHADESLFGQPFDPEQVRLMIAGQVPDRV